MGLGRTTPQAESLRKYWANISPEDYKKRCEASSSRNRARWASMSVEEYRSECGKISRRKKRWWGALSPEAYLDLLLKNSRGQKAYWAGMSEEAREGKVQEFRERMRRWRAGLSVEEYEKLCRSISESMGLVWESLSEAGKADWLRRSFLQGGQVQTWPEKLVEMWLEENRPGEYRYNGADKEVIIGGRAPDFVNIRGKKEVVEVFGMYWHSGDEEPQRIAHYKKYGFDCRVIWEWDCDPVELDRTWGAI